jgi:hypothetical protein
MDKETKRVLTNLEQIKRTQETPGWRIIVDRLNGLIEDLCDIRNVKEEDKESRLYQLDVRAAASEIVETWIKAIQDEADWSDKTVKVMEENVSSKIYQRR